MSEANGTDTERHLREALRHLGQAQDDDTQEDQRRRARGSVEHRLVGTARVRRGRIEPFTVDFSMPQVVSEFRPRAMSAPIHGMI